MRFTYYLSIAMLAMSVAFTSCKDGKDGDPGPAGQNGTNGANGENGAGFNEAVKYGKITLTLTGKRPDGPDFTQTQDLRFAPTGAYDVYDWSGVLPVEGGLEFSIGRFFGTVDDVYQENYVYVNFSVDNTTATPVFSTYDFEVYTSVITSDSKYFYITGDFAGINPTYSNYSYDAATGKLKFNFSFTIPAESNNTGNDLTVSGSADVTVLQSLVPAGPSEG